MPEALKRGLIAAGMTPPAEADPVEPAGDAAPLFVTKADLEVMMGKVTSDFKAEIGRLRKTVKPEPVKAADSEPEGDPAEGDKQSWHKTVTNKLQEVERREGIAQKGARRSQIRAALVAAGADPELADLAVPAILEGDGGSFKIALNEQTGEYAASYQDGTLADWSKAYLLTPQGKRIVAPKAVPSLSGVPGRPADSSGRRQVPASQASALTHEELYSGNVEIVPG